LVTQIFLLDFAKIFLAVVLLAYASWCDWRVREVSDKVWIVFISLGLPLTLLQILLIKNLELFYPLTFSFVTIFVLSLLLSYLGLFGDADLKALICLSLTFPWPLSGVGFRLKPFSPIFSLSILGNSLILCVLTVIPFILIKNLEWKLKNKDSLFRNFEDEPLSKKFLMLTLVGFKVKKEKLKTPHYSLAEEIKKSKDGKIKRSLKLSSALTINDLLEEKANIESLPEEVWVTPRIPMIIFILGGFITATFIGDFTLLVLVRVIGF